MHDPSSIDPSALPSRRALFRATVGAVLLASVLLVAVVLPAETGRDPSGVGAWLGLTRLGAVKTGGAVPASAAAPAVEEPAAFTFHTDELTITLQPNEGTEVKAVMRAGDQLVYTWTTDQGELFYDFHGEPAGAAADVFTSFETGTESTTKGDFEAPFEGIHGWYWKNRTPSPVTVHLTTSGVYQKISRK
jgi:hypothetical protein